MLGPTSWQLDDDVRRVANNAIRGRPASWNTYIGHGLGWTAQERTVDFWAPQGRGWPISPRVGTNILKYLWNLPGAPYINRYIWQGQIWIHDIGIQAYWDPQDLHFDHLHVGYW